MNDTMTYGRIGRYLFVCGWFTYAVGLTGIGSFLLELSIWMFVLYLPLMILVHLINPQRRRLSPAVEDWLFESFA